MKISIRIVQYCPILTNIVEYCPYCLILATFNIVQYCIILFNITEVTISAYSYQSCDIERNIQILSKIVKYVPILSSIDQYCLIAIAHCLDIFPLKINLSHFKSDLDAAKIGYIQLWKIADIQTCKYARLSFSYKTVILSLAITCKNKLFLAKICSFRSLLYVL